MGRVLGLLTFLAGALFVRSGLDVGPPVAPPAVAVTPAVEEPIPSEEPPAACDPAGFPPSVPRDKLMPS